MKKLFSKESVGKIALVVSSSIAIVYGVALHETDKMLDKTIAQLGEERMILEQKEYNYRQLEKKILNIESEGEKLLEKQKELTESLKDAKVDNEILGAENKRLRSEIDSLKKDFKKTSSINRSNSTPNVSSNGKLLLARLVTAEAKGEPFAGQVAVAEVVLNRVESEKFPDTIKGVVYQSNQFSPVSNGSINNQPTQQAKEAVERALKGTNKTNGALFFYNDSIVNQSWLQSRTTATRIGSHVFKY